jgi:hypothetical protein
VLRDSQKAESVGEFFGLGCGCQIQHSRRRGRMHVLFPNSALEAQQGVAYCPMVALER